MCSIVQLIMCPIQNSRESFFYAVYICSYLQSLLLMLDLVNCNNHASRVDDYYNFNFFGLCHGQIQEILNVDETQEIVSLSIKALLEWQDKRLDVNRSKTYIEK